MKNKLCKIIEKCGIHYVVNTCPTTVLTFPTGINVEELKNRDVRSAAFKAFGIAKMSEKPVALLIDERFISNILTVVTEVWFQKIDYLIITVNGNLYHSLNYLDRCSVSKNLLIENSNVEEIVENILSLHGPHLLRTDIQENLESCLDYSVLFNELNSYLNKGDYVFCYNPLFFSQQYSFEIKKISSEHQYCVISKYIGFSLGTKSKCVLCIPEKILAYDSNIFNFRNIPESFLIIVFADNSQVLSRLSKWIEANHITVFVTCSLDLSSVFNKKEKTLVYLNK